MAAETRFRLGIVRDVLNAAGEPSFGAQALEVSHRHKLRGVGGEAALGYFPGVQAAEDVVGGGHSSW